MWPREIPCGANSSTTRTHVSSLARSAMRLAAYAGALTNLAVQAYDLRVTREDRMLLNSLLLSISELMWKQSTRTSLYTTRRRRDLTLSALGFSERQRAQLTRDMPFEGPYLFSGQFTPRLIEELTVRQQARELAGQLRQSQPPRHRSFGQPRALPCAQAAPPRFTVSLPSPQPSRGFRGGRGAIPERETPRATRSSLGGPGPRWLLTAYPERLGGRLQAFLPAWAAITDDAFVLSIIRGGFSIELADPLPGGVIRLAPPPPHACLPA